MHPTILPLKSGQGRKSRLVAVRRVKSSIPSRRESQNFTPGKAKMTITKVDSAAQPPNGSSPSRNHEEYQYLDLVREILDQGERRPDRYAMHP